MFCYKNVKQIVTMAPAQLKDGRNLIPTDLGIIKDAAVVFDDRQIYWVGRTDEIPPEYSQIKTKSLPDFVLTPEIVDSHTHIVFGGNRANEYTMRLNGDDYQKIAQAGGGILATMKATLASTEEQLFRDAKERIERIASYGVKTIEIKTGYALTFDGEMTLSKVVSRLKKFFSPKIQIFNTFMAAHAVPASYRDGHEYIDQVVLPLMQELQLKSMVDAVDIFHEKGYFDESDVRKVFELAKSLNIPTKIHADEFNDNNGAALACEYQSLSCDHLLNTSKKNIAKLANSQTVATLLPGTAYFLGKPLADSHSFLASGARVALASDYNPGSCHCDNLLLIASLCAKNMGFNIAQLWAAITLNASYALGLKNQGAIISGFAPRFSSFRCESIDEITYSWGRNFYEDITL